MHNGWLQKVSVTDIGYVVCCHATQVSPSTVTNDYCFCLFDYLYAYVVLIVDVKQRLIRDSSSSQCCISSSLQALCLLPPKSYECRWLCDLWCMMMTTIGHMQNAFENLLCTVLLIVQRWWFFVYLQVIPLSYNIDDWFEDDGGRERRGSCWTLWTHVY